MTIREKIAELAKRNAADDDMMELIEKDLQSLVDYVASVTMMEYSMPIIYARYEGQDVRDKIMALDQRRRDAHERAIMGVKRLNRFSAMSGLPAFYPGDEEDRYAVADFCGIFVKRLYDGRSTDVTVHLADIKAEDGGEGEMCAGE